MSLPCDGGNAFGYIACGDEILSSWRTEHEPMPVSHKDDAAGTRS